MTKISTILHLKKIIIEQKGRGHWAISRFYSFQYRYVTCDKITSNSSSSQISLMFVSSTAPLSKLVWRQSAVDSRHDNNYIHLTDLAFPIVQSDTALLV